MLAPCGGPPHSALKEEARVKFLGGNVKRVSIARERLTEIVFQSDAIQIAVIVFVKFVEFVASKTATNFTN